jgi:uncharacterized membrane protein YidH (DUF202 family)
MTPIASLALLFVAAGLLLLGSASIRRTGGREPSRASGAVLAGMTGLGLGFVLYVLFVPPLFLFPAAVAGILVTDWLRRRQWRLLGSFLVGAGGLWAAMTAWALVNDLTDDAVNYPGWTPTPLAAAVSLVILGATMLVAGRGEGGKRNGTVRSQPHSH